MAGILILLRIKIGIADSTSELNSDMEPGILSGSAGRFLLAVEGVRSEAGS